MPAGEFVPLQSRRNAGFRAPAGAEAKAHTVAGRRKEVHERKVREGADKRSNPFRAGVRSAQKRKEGANAAKLRRSSAFVRFSHAFALLLVSNGVQNPLSGVIFLLLQGKKKGTLKREKKPAGALKYRLRLVLVMLTKKIPVYI